MQIENHRIQQPMKRSGQPVRVSKIFRVFKLKYLKMTTDNMLSNIHHCVLPLHLLHLN